MGSRYSFAALLLAGAAGAAILHSSPGFAARGRGFDLKHGRVKMDVPAAWQDVTELFGIPLMFLGPEKAGGRPVITVVPTGIKNASLDAAEMKKAEEEYQEGRREWLKKYDGVALAFNSLTAEKIPGASEAQSVGYRYRIQDVEFIEKSYYVICNKQFYHLKTVLRGGHEQAYAADVASAVRSFTCE
jgi:hypothetical protein